LGQLEAVMANKAGQNRVVNKREIMREDLNRPILLQMSEDTWPVDGLDMSEPKCAEQAAWKQE